MLDTIKLLVLPPKKKPKKRFPGRAHAPVTTSVVEDRLLDRNPLRALR